jgi:NitT/TauT family transport system permease protein
MFMETDSPSQIRQTTRSVPRNTTRLRLFGIGVVIVWLLVWELSIEFELLYRFLYAPPSAILLRIYRSLIVTDELRGHMWATATRLLVGLTIGAAPALWFGFMMGRNKSACLCYDLLFAALGLIPMTGSLPFFVYIFGIGELNKWAIVSAAVFYPIQYCTKNGVRISRALRYAANSSGHGEERREWQYGAGPWIFTGLKLGTLIGLATLLTAEMYGSKIGLENEILKAGASFASDRAYGALFTVALIAYVLWGCLTTIEYVLSRKREKGTRGL